MRTRFYTAATNELPLASQAAKKLWRQSEVGVGSADRSMTSAELVAIPLTLVDYGLTMTLMSDPEMLLMYE
jgi:hypothetical protein